MGDDSHAFIRETVFDCQSFPLEYGLLLIHSRNVQPHKVIDVDA